MKEEGLKFNSIYMYTQEIFASRFTYTYISDVTFSMGLKKEHCTEIVKLNYLNQSATTFVRTMNEILPELTGIYV